MTATVGRLSVFRRLAGWSMPGLLALTGAGRVAQRRGGATPAAASTRMLTLLRRLVIGYVPLTAALAVAAVFDPRTVMGEPVWIKPLKFSVSIGMNGAALLWLARRRPATPFVRGAALLSAVGLAVEQTLIMVQAARGVRSHFNLDTPFDSAVFAGMGASLAAGVGVPTIALAVVFALRPPQDPVLLRVARSGLGLLLLGFAVGAIMLALGRHSVGNADGGPGLPLVGWSTIAGDLRPAHFVSAGGHRGVVGFPGGTSVALTILLLAGQRLHETPAGSRGLEAHRGQASPTGIEAGTGTGTGTATGAGTGSSWAGPSVGVSRTRSSRAAQWGNHQLAFPNSETSAGSSSIRTTTASSRTQAASPAAICRTVMSLAVVRDARAKNRIRAALVTSRPVRDTPSTMPLWVDFVRS